MEVPERINDERVHYITFLLDLTGYLSELNLQLKAENQFVHVKTFKLNFVFGKFNLGIVTH